MPRRSGRAPSSRRPPLPAFTNSPYVNDPELERVCLLNDEARKYLTDGQVFVTRGIAALPPEDQSAILERVRTYDDFAPANDPYREHDFGAFEHNGVTIFWKIDALYEDPEVKGIDGEPAITRVLTIMLADEW